MDLLVIDTYQQFYHIRRLFAARLDYLGYKQDLKEMFNFQGQSHAYVAMLHANTQNFVNSLDEAGYNVHAKVPRKTNKGLYISFDVDLTIRVLDVNPSRLFLGSTSYNLIPLLKELRGRGCDIVVCAAGVPKAFKKFAHVQELSQDVLRNTGVSDKDNAPVQQLELSSNSSSDASEGST